MQRSFQAQFPAHRAFVVQLQEGTELTPQGIQGRVEHVTSGQAAEFGSLTALLAFMATVLTPPDQLSSADLTDCTT
jgi:hypothetical protein